MVHGANMGPIWGWLDPGGPHVGPMNFAICVVVLVGAFPLDHSTLYSYHKGLIIQSFDCFFIMSMFQLNKQSGCRWFKMPWHSFDVPHCIRLHTLNHSNIPVMCLLFVNQWGNLIEWARAHWSHLTQFLDSFAYIPPPLSICLKKQCPVSTNKTQCNTLDEYTINNYWLKNIYSGINIRSPHCYVLYFQSVSGFYN